MTSNLSRNTILHGDCIPLMRAMPSASVDFILTDPPFGASYRPRDGQTVTNDNCTDWIAPAFAQMYRVLKADALCVSFYNWSKVDLFAGAWRAAGFRMVGHLSFRKRYASRAGYLAGTHEVAYLLAKGHPPRPTNPLSDVIDFEYTGNRLHPTQKPVSALRPLVDSFCPPGGIVLDPFCGSGSSLVAAAHSGCDWLGIELEAVHHRTASRRMANTVGNLS
jgi:DNA modification methylase